MFVRNSSADIVPLLSYVINHGNVTIYEYEHGEPPKDIITQHDNVS